MTKQTQHTHAEDETETACVVHEEDQIEEVLSVLKNGRCRKIMRELDQQALSADELSNRCDVPLSTVYRDVQRLVEVGVLEKRLRISSYPQYTHEYALVGETVTINIGGDSVLSLSVSRQSEVSDGVDQPNQQLSAD